MVGTKKKKQYNWRLNVADMDIIEQDARDQGFSTTPAFINNLFRRYTKGETIKRGS